MSNVLKRLFRLLDREGPPVHAQIEDRLAEAITGGDLLPGTRLPSERELAERFAVSRMALRQALGSLRRRRLLRRAWGRLGWRVVAVAVGAPRLLVERTASGASGVPLEYARDLFRGDRTRVLVESLLAPAQLST